MLFIAEQWRGLALPTPAEARGPGSAAVDQLIIIRIGFEFEHFVV